MMLTICPVNEIKLLAFYSFFAIALLTGPATGLAVSWSRGWVKKLKGVAVGSAVGVLAVVALANMVDTGGLVPAPGEPNRYTFTCGLDLSGNVTLGWTMLYAVQVAAIILTTKFATTSLLSFSAMAMQFAMRLKRNLRQRVGPE
jgi:hypothetical protein